MALQKIGLGFGGLVGDADTVLVQNAGSQKVLVSEIIVHNTGDEDAEIEIWFVPNSTGSVGATSDAARRWHTVVKPSVTQFIPIGERYPLILPNTGDSIQAKSDVDDVISYQLIGDIDS